MRKRLQACKESLAETWDPSWTNNQHEYLREYVKKLEEYSRKYDEWLGRWQRARAEAEAVGLDGSITYDYWKENIQLPEDVTRICKWFDTAQRVIEAAERDDVDRLTKFALDGHNRLVDVTARQESWPRTRRNSIQRRLMRLYHLKTKWETTAVWARYAQAPRHLAKIDHEGSANAQEGFDIVASFREGWRELRAKQRIKRTCVVCGLTAPRCSRSFAYCGGCRHASIPRVDRPRYCSEACQHAHWLAGHMHECPDEEALRKLERLHDDGIIDDDEFRQGKAKALGLTRADAQQGE